MYRNRWPQLFSFILLLVLLLLCLPGCTLWEQAAGRENPVSSPAAEEPEPKPQPRKIRTLPPPEVVLSPARPIQGDHLAIHLGPFLEEPADVQVEAGLRGEMSLPFWHQDRVHILLAISYFNDPGEYPVSIEVSFADGRVWETEALIEVVEGDFPFQSFNMPADRTAGWTSRQLEIDRERVREARENTVPRPLWHGPFQWPLAGRITSDYGLMRSINNRTPTRHSGIDIAAPQGTPLAAANSGFVRLAELQMARGNIIIIDHGLDVCSAYLHLHEIYVVEDQWVEKGEIIGTIGQTGYATGPHLHWSIYVGHSPVSPYSFMDTDYSSTLFLWDRALDPL